MHVALSIHLDHMLAAVSGVADQAVPRHIHDEIKQLQWHLPIRTGSRREARKRQMGNRVPGLSDARCHKPGMSRCRHSSEPFVFDRASARDARSVCFGIERIVAPVSTRASFTSIDRTWSARRSPFRPDRGHRILDLRRYSHSTHRVCSHDSLPSDRRPIAHAAPLAAATTFWAASVSPSAVMILRPLSLISFLPSSTLVPSSRTTSGTRKSSSS